MSKRAYPEGKGPTLPPVPTVQETPKPTLLQSLFGPVRPPRTPPPSVDIDEPDKPQSRRFKTVNSQEPPRVEDVELPEDMPVLDGGSFVQGEWDDNCGKHCMLGWFRSEIGATEPNTIDMTKKYSPENQRVLHAFKQLVEAQWEVNAEEGKDHGVPPLECSPEINHGQIMSYNDQFPNKEDFGHLAKIFNRFTAKLGYTKGNPEASAVEE